MISVFNLYWALLFKRTTLGPWDAHPKTTAKYIQISTPWCFRAHHVLFQIDVSGAGWQLATVHTLGPVLHWGILPREVVEATGLKAPTDHEACWAQCLGFTLIIHYISLYYIIVFNYISWRTWLRWNDRRLLILPHQVQSTKLPISFTLRYGRGRWPNLYRNSRRLFLHGEHVFQPMGFRCVLFMCPSISQFLDQQPHTHTCIYESGLRIPAPPPMVWSPKLTLSGTRDTGPYIHIHT